MSERNYYVMCEDNCRFPGMTAEQILAAIAEATGNTPTSVDDAFITKIREQNANANLKFWVGTTAQYNALTEKDANTFYIRTDDDLEQSLEQIEEDVSALQTSVSDIISGATVIQYASTAGTANYAGEAGDAQNAMNADNATNAENTDFTNTSEWQSMTSGDTTSEALQAGHTYQMRFSLLCDDNMLYRPATGSFEISNTMEVQPVLCFPIYGLNGIEYIRFSIRRNIANYYPQVDVFSSGGSFVTKTVTVYYREIR